MSGKRQSRTPQSAQVSGFEASRRAGIPGLYVSFETIFAVEGEAILGPLAHALRTLRPRRYAIEIDPYGDAALVARRAKRVPRPIAKRGIQRFERILRSVHKSELKHPIHPRGAGCILGPRARKHDSFQLELLARYLAGENLRDLRDNEYGSNQGLMEALRQPIRDFIRLTYRAYRPTEDLLTFGGPFDAGGNIGLMRRLDAISAGRKVP